jgi:hypothetical protein
MAGDNPGGAHLQQTTARNSSIHDGPPIFVILPSIGLISTGSPAADHCSQENVLSVSRAKRDAHARKFSGAATFHCTSIDHAMLKK